MMKLHSNFKLGGIFFLQEHLVVSGDTCGCHSWQREMLLLAL
jgi:hypothetical protein